MNNYKSRNSLPIKMKLGNTDPMNACPVRATSFMDSHVALVSPGRGGGGELEIK
jgi:hypothetical protein